MELFSLKSFGIITILLAVSFSPVFAQEESEEFIKMTEQFYKPTQNALTDWRGDSG